MQSLLQDLRIAVRGFLRTPVFSAVAIVTIGLGVGANTVVFSVVNGILLQPLSFRDPHQVVTVWGLEPSFGRIPITVVDLRDIREQTTLFAGFAGRWSQASPLIGDGEGEEVTVEFAEAEYLPMVGVTPMLGRHFTAEDAAGVLLSHGLWLRRYGADETILGRSIQVDGGTLHVIGVLPPDVNPNLPSTDGVREEADLWRLMPGGWLQGDDRTTAWIRAAGRLRPGVTLAQAQAELDAVAARIREVSQAHADADFQLVAAAVRDDLVAGVRPTLLVLLGAVGFVLLIACSNVANLLLARGLARSKEMAIRSALGGGRRQIVRQLLAESGLLALTGGAVGVVLAVAGVRALAAVRPGNIPRFETVTVDFPVMAFALGASVLAAVLFGLVPAVRASRVDLADALRERAASSGRGHQRMSHGLIVTEVALSLMLLVGAGLLLRSFAEMRLVRPGFETEGLLTLSLTPTIRGDTQEESRALARTFNRTLTERAEALPGVVAVGYTNRLPLGGGLFGGGWANQAMAAAAGSDQEASFRYVNPHFFESMGTRIVAGRPFTNGDGEDVVLVDTKLAALAWPGEDPIGKQLRTGSLGRNGEWSRVVGVVEHMRHASLVEDGRPSLFLPDYLWGSALRRHVTIRTSVDPLSVLEGFRAAVSSLDPNATISGVRTMRQLVGEAMAATRFALQLIGVFAGVAMTLAAIGLYGVISYAVRQRTREIGIRVAFGAQRGVIMRLVLGQGMMLTAAGIVLGLAGAMVVTRLLGSLLFGVSATDPVTFGGVSVLLVIAGLLGSYIPARRALRIDPMVALNAE